VKIACLISAALQLALIPLVATPAHAQFGGFPVDRGETPAKTAAAPSEVTQRWRVGFSVRAENANCGGIFATVPIPTEWPEQTVRPVEELTDVTSHVKKIDYRVLKGGVKQMLATIPFLPSGEEAHAYMTFEVTKRVLVAPDDVATLTIPPRLSRLLRPFVGTSPYIETTHKDIKSLADEIVEGKVTAWEKVEAIYDWVRDHVEYKNGAIKGALAALRDGDGDCEELTSLFIALCRANRIPARTVWIEGHCYPEFYLIDANKKGHWFPCQAAGTRNFGGMFDTRPIMQKGDNFKVPEKKQMQRYVAEFLSAKSVRGSGGPRVRFTRELVLDDQPVTSFR